MKNKLLIIMLLCISLIAIGCGKKDSVVIDNNKQEKEYYFTYEQMDFKIDEPFTKEKFGEPKKYTEIPSCAFEGLDKVYTYDHYEITTYQDKDVERIYSIYLIDQEVTTNEGVKISDTYEQMIEKYGKNFEQKVTQYNYVIGKTKLSFIINNDRIISIEYNLNS